MSNLAFRKSVTNDIYSEYYENRKKYIYLDKVIEIYDFRLLILEQTCCTWSRPYNKE